MAGVPTDELRQIAEEDAEAAFVSRPAEAAPVSSEPHLAASLSAVDRMDARDLETTLMRATVALPAPVLIQEVVGPLLARIGEQWAQGKLSPGHEHFATAVIRRVLESIMNACAAGKSAPTIVVTTPAGQIHEFGALLVGAAAAALGWRVTYLGTSLPGWDIADVARSLEADAIALSIVYPADDPSLPAELVALRDAVGAEMEILVGGRAASNYIEAIQAIQATPMTELSQLVSFLQSRTTGIQEAIAG